MAFYYIIWGRRKILVIKRIKIHLSSKNVAKKQPTTWEAGLKLQISGNQPINVDSIKGNMQVHIT